MASDPNEIITIHDDNDEADVNDIRLDEVVNHAIQLPLSSHDLDKVVNNEWINDAVIDSVINKDVIQGHSDRLLVSSGVWSSTAREFESWGPGRRLGFRLATIPRYSMTFKKAVIPINDGGTHWSVSILDKDTKKCTYYCTMRHNLTPEMLLKLKLICLLLCNEECEILYARPNSFLRQYDGYNCGPMICILTYRILNNESLFFTTADADLWRQEVYNFYLPFVTTPFTNVIVDPNEVQIIENFPEIEEKQLEVSVIDKHLTENQILTKENDKIVKSQKVEKNDSDFFKAVRGIKRIIQNDEIKPETKKAKKEKNMNTMECDKKEKTQASDIYENNNKGKTMELEQKTEGESEMLMTLEEQTQAEKDKNESFDEFCKRKRINKKLPKSKNAYQKSISTADELLKENNRIKECIQKKRALISAQQKKERSENTNDSLKDTLLKSKKAERDKFRRAEMSEQQKVTENEKKAKKRSELTETEKANEASRAKQRMKNYRNPKQLIGAGGDKIDDLLETHYLGPMDQICSNKDCKAKHFKTEKVQGKTTFYSCCQHGKTVLPKQKPYPEELKKLFDLREFRDNIRPLNNVHCFASFNADTVNFGINRPGPYSFVVQGQIYYQINTALKNPENLTKSFGQLYIVDPNEAVETRLNTFSNLNKNITKIISETLVQINCHAKAFQMLHKQHEIQQKIADETGMNPLNLSLHFSLKKGVDPRRFNLQASNEVAAVFATTDDGEIPDSYVTIYDKEGRFLKTVNALDKNVEPWLYPIFFPHGEPIWHHEMKNVFDQKITRMAYAKFQISIRDGEFNAILYGGRLFQQWLVDTALKMVKERVEYLRKHQNQIYRDNYKNIDDFMKKYKIDNNANSVGTKVILPSTHPGSPRYMEQIYQDAMALVRKLGKPDLFVTMTCNPNWREILENLLPGQTPADRPDLIARVFKQKLDYVVDLIEKKGYFGGCKAFVYTIEFQKRGLPHAHLLVTLLSDYKMRTAEVIDRYISAQLPDPEKYPNLFDLVSTHMIHGPCGPRCEKDGKCSKGFAKKFQETTSLDEDAYPTYARPDNGRSVTKSSGFVADNRYIVPHCPNLLLLMNCHINVEVVSSIKAVKYLYKYIFKGHDSAAFKIVDGIVHYDECESFLNSRYMGAAEACWRIFGFELHKQSHSISRLPLHLPNEQTVSFADAENVEDLQAAMDSKNMFMDWFELNKRDPKAKDYFYHEIPEHYTWAPIPNQKLTNPDGTKNKKQYQWKTREAHFKVIGRMYSASPTNPELFHLRILLNHVKGATSYEELKTVGDTVCQTFTQACLELGLIEDDKEWGRVLKEAEVSLLPYQMRNLFVRLLIHCQPIAPHELWENFKEAMSEDFALHFPLDIAIKKAYRQICHLLENEDKNITDFPTMPQELEFDEDFDTYDPIHDEEIGSQMRSVANPEQENIIDKILQFATDKDQEKIVNKCFYIDGPGGTGKTYVYKTLWHLLRSKDKKVSTMAFTGIAAILLPEGKTNHKTLGLPVPIYADSNSNIKPNTKQAKKLLETDVFIWDEAPMAPRYALEIMDRLLRDLAKLDEPFGGKIVILGGDFRQLLPVRKNGTRSECISLSIKYSNLWEIFETYKLHRNMRADPNQLEFAKYLLDIGEGKVNDENDNMEFPKEFIVKTDLVQEVYGTLIEQNRFEEVSNSAILSARNADVDELNKEVVEMLDASTERLYTSIDNAIDGEALQELITQEYLNSLNPPSLPPHELRLRKNTVVMLIRNLSKNEGLVNGTRLLVIGLLNNTLQCKILTGDKKGEIVFIHRILLYNEENYPFTLARRQFPVKIAFAMTINKSQGQTFEKVGLDLRKDVFNHGQLYVACSRVKRASALKIYLGKQRLNKKVKNFVYKEIIQ